MIRYEATFTCTTTDGTPDSGRHTFTYPTLVTDQRQMVELAAYVIGVVVTTRDLTITSVRHVGTVVPAPEVV